MSARFRRSILLGALGGLLAGCTAAPPPSAPTSPVPPGPASSSSTPPTSRSTPTGTPGAAGAGDPYYPADGNGGYDVTAYQVGIAFDPATGRLDGNTVVTATATQDLSRFNLDLRGFDISAVQIDDRPATFRREGAAELVITPPVPLARGATFHTRVRYAGVPVDPNSGQLGGNGWMRTASGGAFAAGEPQSASSWYPVNETPRDKATFALDARVPDGWTVIGNGRETGRESAGGQTTFSWREEKPIVGYLSTVAIDKFSVDRGNLPGGLPIVSAYAPGAESRRAIGNRLPEVLGFLAEKFGPYPQSAAGGIYLDESVGFSLETQTRPIYTREADLETVVHENAHQWYGDAVSVRNWADTCLNECLASYAQWLWAEAKEGSDLDNRYRTAVRRYGSDGTFWGRKLYDMGAGQEFTGVYSKGILALHALRRTVGDAVFFRVLRKFPAAHAGGNASWPDFEQAMATAAGRDLRGFFDAWFRSRTVPARAYLFPPGLR